MLNSEKTQMSGHTPSGAAVLIGGNVDNEMEITTPDEGLDGQYEILN
jgi:transcription elongation GreA/GreB family factor